MDKENIIKNIWIKILYDEIILQNKFPSQWIGDIYIMQIDKNFYSFKENLKKYITKKDDFSKSELSELLTLQWAVYIFPNIKRYVAKAYKNYQIQQSTKNDKNKPDFLVGNQWYEITFTDMESIKFKSEEEFFKKIFQLSREKSEINNENKNDLITIGNKKSKMKVYLDGYWKYIAEKILKRINEKSLKKYNVGKDLVNLIIIFDKNCKYLPLNLELIIENYLTIWKSQIENSLKYFHNIYVMSESIQTLESNNNKISLLKNPIIGITGIKINKDTWKEILKNKNTNKIENKSYAFRYTIDSKTYDFLINKWYTKPK